jgi:ATP-binding cassette subfamily B multidrug efflux pump
MYLGLMIWPMLALAWMFNIVERGSAAYSRIRDMLAEAPVVNDGSEPVPTGRGELNVAVRAFTYPQTEQVTLENVNFRLQPGQMLGICGPTGAGKSTILSLIQRHFDIDQGEIRFHDIPLTQLQLDSWRSRLAVVSQTPFLFSDTVANNIALGCPQATREAIEHVARLASVHDDILRLPQGYETEVGERGVMLSGGQKQRLAIARALAARPSLLVADEPISALDASTQTSVAALMRDLVAEAGAGMLFISHDLAVVRRIADRTHVMFGGRVLESGPTAEVWVAPRHPYTRALLAAIPEPDGEGRIPVAPSVADRAVWAEVPAVLR